MPNVVKAILELSRDDGSVERIDLGHLYAGQANNCPKGRFFVGPEHFYLRGQVINQSFGKFERLAIGHLWKHRDHTVCAVDLMKAIWPNEASESKSFVLRRGNDLRALLSRIRKKIGDDTVIETVKAVGYRMNTGV